MRNELLEESQTYNEPFDRWLWAQSTLRLFGEQAQLNPDNADESTLVLFPTVNQLRPNAAHPVRITVDFATQRIAVVATVPGMVRSRVVQLTPIVPNILYRQAATSEVLITRGC